MVLQPEHITALVDTRERMPLDLSPLRMETATLSVGDYSLKGMSDEIVAVERKSLGDFLSCCGVERARYERQLLRLKGIPHKLVVIEATWQQIEAGGWRNKITPKSVTGSVLGWMSEGVPFVFAGDHDNAGRLVARFLHIVARRRWREACSLMANGENGESRT